MIGAQLARIILSAEDKTSAAFKSLGRNVTDAEGQIGRLRGVVTGVLAVLAAPVAFAAFDRLTRQAASFQQLSEKVGDSAERFASLAVAAGVSGTQMDSIAAASIKLTKNLVGVDDESKEAGAALKALGLNIEEFKRLNPADQMETVAKALARFEDGASKTAVAVALFGKSGADLIPFLRDLAEEGARQVILTDRQIEQADRYEKKQNRLRTEINLHAQAVATQMVPAYTAFQEALLEVIKEIGGVEDGARGLRNDRAIQDWAESAAMSVAFVVDSFDGASRAVKAIGLTIGAAAAQAALVAQGEFRAAMRVGQDWQRELDALAQSEFFSDRLSKRLAALNSGSGVSTGDFARMDRKSTKPSLKFDGAKDKGKAEAEAKARLAADIDAIKKESDQLIAVYANSEKIMEAVRAAGLLSEKEYYDAKRGFVMLESAAKEEALQREIARYKLESAAGKDKIENDRKIAAAEAQLTIQRGKTAADLQVLTIQQEAAVRRVARAYEEARLSAEKMFETTAKQLQRDLDTFGRGDKERQRAAALNSIDDRFQGQRDELEMQKRLLEFEGKFTDEARQQYELRLSLIDEYHAKAVSQWDAHYEKLLGLQRDWSQGANRALENYIAGTEDVAGQIEDAFNRGFEGMEDALTDFVTTGKLDFKSLADSIIADITRIIIRQQVTGPLASAIQGGMSSGEGAGGWLSSIFRSIFGGARAGGGPVDAGKLYRVNERGPEMLDLQGQQFLMMGAQGGMVQPLRGGGGNVTVNYHSAPGESRATTLQNAAHLRRVIETAGRNA